MFIAPEEVVKFRKYFKEKVPNLEYFLNFFTLYVDLSQGSSIINDTNNYFFFDFYLITQEISIIILIMMPLKNSLQSPIFEILFLQANSRSFPGSLIYTLVHLCNI